MDWARFGSKGSQLLSAALVAASVMVSSMIAYHCEAAVPGSRFKRVVIVVLENTDFASAIAKPFLTDLANRGALLTQFHAPTHPSQPNYIAMIAGSTYGIDHNRNVDLSGNHIGDLLEATGRGWKTYAEGYPGNCFKGGSNKDYARKHNPFISFINVQNNPQRCARIVPAEQFEKDAATGDLPEYSMYIPDQKNDGHNTGVGFADRWLAQKFTGLLNDPRFMKDTLFVVTFDENLGGYPNIVYTALYGPGVRPGARSAALYTHYGLLRTIEDELGLGTLGKEDAAATPITDIWL